MTTRRWTNGCGFDVDDSEVYMGNGRENCTVVTITLRRGSSDQTTLIMPRFVGSGVEMTEQEAESLVKLAERVKAA